MDSGTGLDGETIMRQVKWGKRVDMSQYCFPGEWGTEVVDIATGEVVGILTNSVGPHGSSKGCFYNCSTPYPFEECELNLIDERVDPLEANAMPKTIQEAWHRYKRYKPSYRQAYRREPDLGYRRDAEIVSGYLSGKLVLGCRYDEDKLAFTAMLGTPENQLMSYSGLFLDLEGFFDADGRYLGPDEDGIEPLFAAASIAFALRTDDYDA